MATNLPTCVHPQVALQLADHYINAQIIKPPRKYNCGILFGINDGTTIELTASFEIPVSDDCEPDNSSFRILSKQQIALYKEEQLIGFYTIGKYSDEEISKLLVNFEHLGISTIVRIEYIGTDESPIYIL